MTFDETFLMVKRAIDSGRPAHGYLIVGSVRNHGMKLTHLIIQNLFCTAEEKPCKKCASCRRVEEHTEPDVHWIFPEMKSRVISAEQMREKLLAEISQTSFSGGWKVGVLVGADRLNDSSANAFLKTLEEPPEKTLFLLLTDTPQQVIPTIISRCQRIDLDAFRELSEPWLGTLVSTLSSPYFRTPLERLVMSEQLSKLLEDIKEKAEAWVKEESEKEQKVEEDEDLFLARVSARYREMRMDFLVTLMRWFRDLFVVKAGGGAEIHFKEKADLFKERAARLTLAQTLYNVNAIEELARQLDRNLSEETVLAYAIDRIFHGVGDKP
jgi:DNA polymerase III subunit delta'